VRAVASHAPHLRDRRYRRRRRAINFTGDRDKIAFDGNITTVPIRPASHQYAVSGWRASQLRTRAPSKNVHFGLDLLKAYPQYEGAKVIPIRRASQYLVIMAIEGIPANAESSGLLLALG